MSDMDVLVSDYLTYYKLNFSSEKVQSELFTLSKSPSWLLHSVYEAYGFKPEGSTYGLNLFRDVLSTFIFYFSSMNASSRLTLTDSNES